MLIEVFGNVSCALCVTARQAVDRFVAEHAPDAVEVEFIDMDTVYGLAEGMFRDANDLPTIIVSQDGVERARWGGTIPDSAALKQAIEAAQ